MNVKYHHILLVPPIFAGTTLLGRMSYLESGIDVAKKIWIFGGSVRTSFWSVIFETFGENQLYVFVAGSLFATIIWYWLLGAVYTLMDVFLKPERLRKYKIQPGTNEPLETVRLWKVVEQIVYNQTVVGVPVIYLGGMLMLWRKPPPLRQIPDIHWVILQFVFSAFVEEIFYYYIHRLFHSKYLYKKFHKRHHEWSSPVAITAIYCHPLEQIFANLAPIFLGPFLLNAHVTTYLSWFFLAVFFTLSEHSGYHLPFMTSSEYHDYHHLSVSMCQKTKPLGPPPVLLPAVGVFLLMGFLLNAVRSDPKWYEASESRQKVWNKFLDYVGDDIEDLLFYGSWFIFFGFYWFVGTLFTLMDVYNKPGALRRYKVQPGTNEPVDNKRLIQVISLVLFNQTIVSLPVIYLATKVAVWYGTPNVRELPSVLLATFQIIGCVLIEEIGFYYSHRLLHHRSIYKHIHKKHHEWTAPIAIVAIYAHPLEHIVSNLIPPFLGVLFLGCHVTTAWAWFALAITFTLGEHSGYHLPLMPSSEAHDYHHFKFNNCFGVLGILDNLHGTNENFKAAVNYKRHRFLTSLKSMHEIYPEEVKEKKN